MTVDARDFAKVGQSEHFPAELTAMLTERELGDMFATAVKRYKQAQRCDMLRCATAGRASIERTFSARQKARQVAKCTMHYALPAGCGQTGCPVDILTLLVQHSTLSLTAAPYASLGQASI